MKKKGWIKIRYTRQLDGCQRMAWYDKPLAWLAKPLGYCLAYRKDYAWLAPRKEGYKCALGGLAITAAVAVWAIAVMLLEGW